MRTSFLSFSTLLLCFLMISCSGEPDPRDTGTEFLRSLKEGEFSKAGKHASESTGSEIDKLLNNPDAEILKGLPEDIVPGRFEKESEDRGIFYYLDGQEEKSIVMVREDGDWKVEVPDLIQLSPQIVAKRFLEAFKKQAFEEASQYSTERTAQQLDMLKRTQADKRLGQKEVNITIGEVSYPTPNSAEVSYEDDGREKVLKMMLVEGEWKANWSKMDDALSPPNEEEADDFRPPPPPMPEIEVPDPDDDFEEEEIMDEIVGPEIEESED